MKNVEIVSILEFNVIFKISNKISKKVKNNSISSLISSNLNIINKISIRIINLLNYIIK